MDDTAFGSLFGNVAGSGDGEQSAFGQTVRAISQSILPYGSPSGAGRVGGSGENGTLGDDSVIATPRIVSTLLRTMPSVSEFEDGLDGQPPHIDLEDVPIVRFGFLDQFNPSPFLGQFDPSSFDLLGGPGDVFTGAVGWTLLGGRDETAEPPPPPPPPGPPPPPDPPEFLEDVLGFDGSGQTIVIIDDGTSPFYDQSNTVFEFDFADNDNDASVNTVNSHGSQVAQVALQIASQVNVIHLKVFSDFAELADRADIEAALQWVVGNAGDFNISAVNMSLGSGNSQVEVTSDISDELADLANLGIFTVVAAGNFGDFIPDGVSIFAADPNAIAVSATDENDRFASFSQRSQSLTDISALGVRVPVITTNDQVLGLNGTSFSAPLITGIAALLQDAAEDVIQEDLEVDEFLEILQESSRPIVGAPNAPGFRIADPFSAVEYFLDNADSFDDLPNLNTLDTIFLA